MTDRPLWQWSATEVAAATRTGDVSCRDVTAAVVARMRDVNPRLNAITLDLGDEALAAAEASTPVAGTARRPVRSSVSRSRSRTISRCAGSACRTASPVSPT